MRLELGLVPRARPCGLSQKITTKLTDPQINNMISRNHKHFQQIKMPFS